MLHVILSMHIMLRQVDGNFNVRRIDEQDTLSYTGDGGKCMYRPQTKRHYDLFEVASALQKSIRRADTKVAGYFVVELFESGFHNYAWKRLVTVSAEDCRDFVTQEIMALHAGYEFINKAVAKGKPQKGRIFLAKAVIVLCQAIKSRDADLLTNYVYDQQKMMSDEAIDKLLAEARAHPEPIPAYAFDVHTKRGKNAGKTKEMFFIEEQAALDPADPESLFADLVPSTPQNQPILDPLDP